MNEYAALGLMIEASEGKRIIVVERDYREIQTAVDVFAREIEANDLSLKVRRVNGDERVRHPSGGWISFATPRGSRMRGKSAHVVFIDNDADRVHEGDPNRMDDFRVGIVGVLASTQGKVVRS